MSVLEQDTTSESSAGVDMPSFPVVMRGYDRQQVHAFVLEQASRLAAERRRADSTERAVAQLRHELAASKNQPPPSFEHLGAEAAKVLEQAGNSAKLLVEEARSRGEAIVHEAETEAAELIEKAQQRGSEIDGAAHQMLTEATAERDRILTDASAEAEELRQRAEDQAAAALEAAREAAEHIRQKALDEQLSMQAETERLRDSRERMLGHLSRMHADLVALLSEAVEDGAVAEPSADANGEAEAEARAQKAASRETEDTEAAARWDDGR